LPIWADRGLDPVVMGESRVREGRDRGQRVVVAAGRGNTLREIQWETRTADGRRLVNGEPEIRGVNELRQVGGVVQLAGRSGPEAETGPISPCA
jgi:hypothetical protein